MFHSVIRICESKIKKKVLASNSYISKNLLTLPFQSIYDENKQLLPSFLIMEEFLNR